MSEMSTGKTVRTMVDFDNMPPLTDEEHAQLDRLKAMRDEDIDFSDIPSQAGKTGWVRGNLKERIAQRIAERVARDAAAGITGGSVIWIQPDVFSFFKESGDASEGRINAVLREYAETHRKSA